MPNETITIRVTKTVEHKDASPRWRVGTQIITTREELSRRGVPTGSYVVVAGDETQKTSTPAATPKK